MASAFEKLTRIADNIRAKDFTTEPLTLDGMAEHIAALEVNIPYEVPIVEKDFNFYDIDGVLIRAYTYEELSSLGELPEVPKDTDNLICEGWNYTFEECMNNVGAAIAPIYKTKTGDTLISINCQSYSSLDFSLKIKKPSYQTRIRINWGDGAEEDTSASNNFSITVSHTYEEPGFYTIALHSITNDIISFDTDSSSNLTGSISDGGVGLFYGDMIREINIGDNFTLNNGYEFQYLFNINRLTIPSTITEVSKYMLYYTRLRVLALPNTVKEIPNYFAAQSSIYQFSIPMSVTTIGSGCFANTWICDKIFIPNGVTTVSTGGTTWSTSSIGSEVYIDFSNVQSIYSLPQRAVFHNPDVYITSIDSIANSAFADTNLTRVEISGSLTSIPNSVFARCYNLTSVILESNISVINAAAFQYCRNLETLYVRSSFPPILSSSNCLQGTSKNLLIIVPQDSVEAYKKATNWSLYSSKIIGDSDYDNQNQSNSEWEGLYIDEIRPEYES